MRIAAYAATSAVLAAGALLKAFNQRPNFYSATVYLSQSNACVLILTNLALLCTCTFIYALQRLLYGPLRPIEIEQLSEKAWYAVLDTLLAMPSMRDDMGGWLLAIFVLLLTGKVWSWIGEGRVDILEQQPPANPRLFHARLSASLFVSIAFSALMFRYCLATVMDDPRPGMMVIFTFEFAILTIFSAFTTCRYILALVEARIIQQQTKAKIEERQAEIRLERVRLQQEAGDRETPNLPREEDVDENDVDVPGWEEKRRWLFALELATDFIKIIVYTVFFTISPTFIGLPLHVMRDVYMTIASFTKRIQDYNNYKRATHDMNTRYPDATAEELQSDNTCIVCREAMIPWVQPPVEGGPPRSSINEGQRAKKLPCGHILHLRCLKAWLERQQACPTCRRSVITPAAPAARDAQANARPLPAAGGQQAPGANGPAAAAGNPARPQGLPARMRWLNMGPVRVGFYNGPANRVREALQREHPGAGTANVGTVPPSVASATTQAQLRSIELRLLQQAYEMNIEQSQLANVRALELELARLRAQRASGSGTMNTYQQAVDLPIDRGGQPNPSVPFPPHQSLPQTFQPLPHQQPLGSGHPELPQGMTLPDGWSVLPLQRVGGQVPLGAHWAQAQTVGPFASSATTVADTPAVAHLQALNNAQAMANTQALANTQVINSEANSATQNLTQTRVQQRNDQRNETAGRPQVDPRPSVPGPTGRVPTSWNDVGWSFSAPPPPPVSSDQPAERGQQSSSAQPIEQAQPSSSAQSAEPAPPSSSIQSTDQAPPSSSDQSAELSRSFVFPQPTEQTQLSSSAPSAEPTPPFTFPQPTDQRQDPGTSSGLNSESESKTTDNDDVTKTNGESSSSKGKGKAVEVEDVQDAEG